MSQDLVTFSDETFEQDVLKSDVPVLVDFWAEWCMPCRMLTPIIESVAREYGGKVKFGKLDTDANREVAIKYSINSIPTVILFKGGVPAGRFVGVRKAPEIKDWLEKSLTEAS